MISGGRRAAGGASCRDAGWRGGFEPGAFDPPQGTTAARRRPVSIQRDWGRMMSIAEGKTRSRLSHEAITAQGREAAQSPPGPTLPPTLPLARARDAQTGRRKFARDPTRPSGVDWTLTIRRRLDRSGGVWAAEIDALAASVSRVVNVEADTDIVREGDTPTECRLLLEGWTCRYVPLKDGRPQILGLQLAGDALDLQGLLRGEMDHVIATLTPCRIGIIPHGVLHGLVERHPGIGRLIQVETATEAAITRRWLLNAGHRQAYAGMAHLICELFTRAAVAGMTEAFRFPMPLTQTELGSALGLTSVHANRTMKRLQQAGLVSKRCRWMTIEDWDGLRKVAEFDPAYLNLDFPPP